MVLKLIIIAALGMIFVQDASSRAVYWLLFPILATLILLYRLSIHPIADAWPVVLTNCMFLLAQLLLVSVWFTLKSGSWVNLTKQHLGWGDILFLCCAACYFSIISFIVFYIISLILVMIAWAVRQGTARKKSHHIPLAGWQALLMGIALLTDWWMKSIDLTSDAQLTLLLTR